MRKNSKKQLPLTAPVVDHPQCKELEAISRITDQNATINDLMLQDLCGIVEFIIERHTFDNYMDLSFFLEDLLGRRVELVTPESLSPRIAPHILREVERVEVAA